MVTTPDRMQIPEYVKRELAEVYLLMDHIAGRRDKKLDEALAPPTAGGAKITLEELCGVSWPPPDQNRAKVLALVLTAKDRLSHAAFPASARSVAFTYFSIIPHSRTARKSLGHRVVAHVRRLTWGRGGATPGKPPDADAQGGTSANGDSGADADALHISTMAQFARDAFPGLEAKRRWFVRIMTSLAGALLILLLLTCAVSWNLAIGQRLLTDYRWLSLHPAVLQTDPAPAPGTPCAAQQTSQQRPAADNAPASAPKDGGETAASGDPMPGSHCARFLAFERIQPMMKKWIGRQIVLAWLIHGKPPSTSSPQYQGYILELTRVLVTTLNYNVLPLVLGALAATAAALRSLNRKVAGNELEPRDLMQVWPRVLLGAFLGAVIGLFISPGASNGLFSLVGGPPLSGTPTAAADTSDTVAVSPAAFAFLAGFATGRIFQWLDNLVERIFAFANPQP
jgi:hypothetical protein